MNFDKFLTPYTFVAVIVLTIFVGQGQPASFESHHDGFTWIGQWRDESKPSAVISYYVSSQLASQQEALLACQDLAAGGRLVTPLDRSQYDTVIGALETAETGVVNSMLWTAGQHDGDSKWFWLTTGQEIESDVLVWAGSFPVGSKGHGLSIVFYPPNIGYGDSFGVTSSRKFICEITSEDQ